MEPGPADARQPVDAGGLVDAGGPVDATGPVEASGLVDAGGRAGAADPVDAGGRAGAAIGAPPGPLTTAAPQPPAGPAPRRLVAAVRRLEAAPVLDAAARPLAAAGAALVRSPGLAGALRGRWLGHALHPLLTDFPLGAWTSASFLDLFGGRHSRPAAQRLVGFGLLAAAPTVASGLAEWQTAAGRGSRRVGVVHAAVNTGATLLYGCSWLSRRRGNHARAVALGVGGGVVATVGGYLGGHLSLVRKLGSADPGFGPDPAGPPPG